MKVKVISRKYQRNSQETEKSMASKHGAFGPLLAMKLGKKTWERFFSLLDF